MNADASVMTVGCKQPGCCNMCSVFVYPYCYEHIESKISEHPPQGVINICYPHILVYDSIDCSD